MELITYLAVLFSGYLYIITRSKPLLLATLASVLIYIITSKALPPSVDMKVYYQLVEYFFPYMTKEFLYYGLSHILYRTTGTIEISFILLDILIFSLLLLTLRKNIDFKKSIFIIIIIYSSFVGVMGLQNVYRQFLGSIILLCSYIHFINGSRIKALAFNFTAVFFHNAIIISIPLFIILILKENIKEKRIFLTLSAIGLVGFLILFFSLGLSFKSNRETGGNFMMIYWLLSLLTYFALSSKAITRKPSFSPGSFYISILLPAFLLSGGSTAGERIFMLFFPIIIFEIVQKYDDIKVRKSALQAILLTAATAPTLLFHSARQFIL